MSRHRERIQNLDAATKVGNRLFVISELRGFDKSKMSEEQLMDCGRLANRNHDYNLGLQFLYSHFRPGQSRARKPSPETIVTYATSLIGVGANAEASKLLQGVRDFIPSRLPYVFALFSEWNYEKAIPCLKSYINKQTDSYQEMIGNINLVAAYIGNGDFARGDALLAALRPELASDPRFRILFGNSWELQAQIDIQNGEYQKAFNSLELSTQALGESLSRYILYVNKWRAIAGLSLEPSNPEKSSELSQVRTQALKIRNWETVRDCDFHGARIQQKSVALERVLLGTPYPGFHARVAKVYGWSALGSKTFSFCPGDVSQEPEKILLQAQHLPENVVKKWTSRKVLQLLLNDIYKPPRLGVAFQALYPEEQFNPFSSPQRVRNAVFRFNESMAAEGLRLRAEMQKGDLFLRAESGQGLEVLRGRALPIWHQDLLKFKKSNVCQHLTAKDLAEFLGVSKRTAHQILRKAIAARRLRKNSQGRGTYYVYC